MILTISIIILVTAIVAIAAVETYSIWKEQSLDIEFEASKPATRKHMTFCPLCGDMLDMDKTQKVANSARGCQMCCIIHTNREIVDYIKKVNSEVSQDEKRKETKEDIHG